MFPSPLPPSLGQLQVMNANKSTKSSYYLLHAHYVPAFYTHNFLNVTGAYDVRQVLL